MRPSISFSNTISALMQHEVYIALNDALAREIQQVAKKNESLPPKGSDGASQSGQPPLIHIQASIGNETGILHGFYNLLTKVLPRWICGADKL